MENKKNKKEKKIKIIFKTLKNNFVYVYNEKTNKHDKKTIKKILESKEQTEKIIKEYDFYLKNFTSVDGKISLKKNIKTLFEKNEKKIVKFLKNITYSDVGEGYIEEEQFELEEKKYKKMNITRRFIFFTKFFNENFNSNKFNYKKINIAQAILKRIKEKTKEERQRIKEERQRIKEEKGKNKKIFIEKGILKRYYTGNNGQNRLSSGLEEVAKSFCLFYNEEDFKKALKKSKNNEVLLNYKNFNEKIAEDFCNSIFVRGNVNAAVFLYYNGNTEIIEKMKEIAKKDFSEIDFEIDFDFDYTDYYSFFEMWEDKYQNRFIENLSTDIYNFIAGIVFDNEEEK